ncbi:MAG: outer membrane beta-barrel protein [Methylovirgula sp.]|jgi:outer membrane immunogenic protein
MKNFALAGCLLLLAVPASAAPPAPVYDWTGFYIGANVGYGWGKSDPGTISFFNPGGVFAGSIPGITANTNGVVGGAQGGYNYQVGNFVAGFEGDFSGAGIYGSVSDPVNAYTASTSVDWLATARGRVGYAFDRFLIYATGGFAAAGAKATLNDSYPPIVITTSSARTYTGWAAGGGAEWAIDPNWSVRAEYLYLGLGTRQFSFSEPSPPGWPLITVDPRLSEQVVRVGIDYKFGAPPVPVAAKY